MNWLFREHFEPEPRETRRLAAVAEFLLYLRSHWFRMPLPMLIRHLSIKAVMRVRERFAPKPAAD